MNKNDLYKIISSAPNLIQIEISDITGFKRQEKQDLSVGSYLKISDDDGYTILAIVTSFKIKDPISEEKEKKHESPKFILDAQPIGSFYKGEFIRGGNYISIPPTTVEIADNVDLESIYSLEDKDKFSFAHLAQDKDIQVNLNGNNFFSKHIAVVGSTGSGKSCTVAKILHNAITPSKTQKAKSFLNNSHIIIFDIHGEYEASFPNANIIKIENMVLPYWLMNADELEEVFIESKDSNAYNQISIFKKSVTNNKKRHNKTGKVRYDSPTYFSLEEIYNYIKNLNNLTTYQKDGKVLLATQDKESEYTKDNLWEEINFEESTGNSKHEIFKVKVSRVGGFTGELEKFISRLETKINDERLSFLLNPRKSDGTEYKTKDLESILRKFIGYINGAESNTTIIDLSGVPFEILNIIVSLITRLLFDFGFHYKHLTAKKAEIPLLLVYEEAHKYIPRVESTKSSVTNSIERIAKEGRKYGLSLMIVSQRPSEVSETVFSQCNNFVAMRLTNPTDQRYVQRLLPDSMEYMTHSLPTLKQREAIIVGDSIAIPSIVTIDDLTSKPNSKDIDYYSEWNKNWITFDLKNLIKKFINK